MDNAQLYLSLVRPSMIPVVGESADDLFRQQIEVTGWKWGFHNLKEQKEAERKRKIYAERADYLEKSSRMRTMEASLKALEAEHEKTMETLSHLEELADSDPSDADARKRLRTEFDRTLKTIDRNLARSIAEIHRDADLIEQQRRRGLRQETQRERIERHHRQQVEDRELQMELENQKFSFSFTKRVDIATTQMLNSMKAGDVFPLAIFTMHQYSSNNPMSLVIKVEGLRLVRYGFNVDTSDTMTDLKEEWTCDFKAFSYVYQNRRSFAKPSVGGVSDAKQVAAKAATQGTVRTFVMLPRKS